MRYRHLHLSAGKLALGLVIPATSGAGLDVTIAARARSEESLAHYGPLSRTRSYVVESEDTRKPVLIDDVLFYGNDAASMDGLRAVVADPATVLLTTAVGDALEQSRFQHLIADLLCHRVHAEVDQPLYVVACENTRHSYWVRDALENLVAPRIDSAIAYEKRVIYLPSMVHRICTDIRIDRDEITVRASGKGLWQIQSQDGIPDEHRLSTILQSPHDEVTIEYLEHIIPHWRKKIWLFNGPHLLAALHAHLGRYIFFE